MLACDILSIRACLVTINILMVSKAITIWNVHNIFMNVNSKSHYHIFTHSLSLY